MENTKPIITKHFNVGQLRTDLWNMLKIKSIALLENNNKIERVEKLNVEIIQIFKDLNCIEMYFSFPGKFRLKALERTFNDGKHQPFTNHVADLVRLMISDEYRYQPALQDDEIRSEESVERSNSHKENSTRKKYFEVLYIEDLTEKNEKALRKQVDELADSDEYLVYDILVQRSFQDALIAMLFNFNIQSVVICYAPPYRSRNINDLISPFIQNVLSLDLSETYEADLGPILGGIVKRFRPELDVYYVTDTALPQLKDTTLYNFRRIFYRIEDFQELHLAIIRGMKERFETPFYHALKEYSQKPVGVFHAMPISRGNSVFQSRWIRGFGKFYGRNLFLAETSSTSGGLDSLLQPTGSLKKAQDKAAVAYGARYTFFVTNGTSTANKVVQQALIQPGDLVLVDRDCHKSHHYGLVLSGAFPVYLDSYPIEKYSIYGAVPLEHIKHKLLELKAANRLDKVKMLLLTNCTFDGLVYNVERVMEEVLAIKEDMVFLWDEAWFAFAGFTYTYKQRTGMFTAQKLYKKYKSPEYLVQYENHIAGLKPGEPARMPNPHKVKIRVYSTQSTHKTLSSFRQGSMIHIWDEDYRSKVADAFQEAYMTHTSTSPNYQILASLDVGRRQVQFEGYEMVEKSIEMAMVLRAKIHDHPRLKKYFKVLTVKDFIPDEYRASGLGEYYTDEGGWNRMEYAWKNDEFVLDPTKVTLSIGKSGIDGDTFKNKYLMDQFNIQINKTSRNTVLFMTNIGTTRGSVAYLLNALLNIADELDSQHRSLNSRESEILQLKIESLVEKVPPLPDFSSFHSSFQAVPGVPGGNIRQAYYLAYQDEKCEYIPLHQCLELIRGGRQLVSTTFVIPYPPGFPVLVPGQLVNEGILRFLIAIDVKEIHGYHPDLGLKVFKQVVLDRQKTVSAMAGMKSKNHEQNNKKNVQADI